MAKQDPSTPQPRHTATDFRRKHRQASHDQAHADSEIDDAPAGRHASVPLVETQAELDQLVTRLGSSKSFAYDTEFIGETSYRPQLCLIQVAVADSIWLIDPMADLELSLFWDLLCEPSIRKIAHAGEQDLEHVWRFAGKPPVNVVDTQVAAGMVGLTYPVSLAKLVQELLGVSLQKGFTFTDWSQRPLSSSQLKYGAEDVRYLCAVWNELELRLTQTRRLAWLEEECAWRCADSDPAFDLDRAMFRVRGSASLRGKQWNVLRALLVWREACAKEADMPSRSFLKDEVLVDLSRHPPKSTDKLGQIKHFPRPLAEQQGKKILLAIEQGQADLSPGVKAVIEPELGLSAKHRLEHKISQAQSICFEQGLDPALVMTKQDVADLFLENDSGKPLRLLQGWRKLALGTQLKALKTS